MTKNLGKLIFWPPIIGAFSVGFALIPGTIIVMALTPKSMELFGSNPFLALLAFVSGAPFLSIMGLPISLPICFIAQFIIGLPLYKCLSKFNIHWASYALIGYLLALPICLFVISKMEPRAHFQQNLASALSLALVGACQALATYHYAQKIKQSKQPPVTNH